MIDVILSTRCGSNRTSTEHVIINAASHVMLCIDSESSHRVIEDVSHLNICERLHDNGMTVTVKREETLSFNDPLSVQMLCVRSLRWYGKSKTLLVIYDEGNAEFIDSVKEISVRSTNEGDFCI